MLILSLLSVTLLQLTQAIQTIVPVKSYLSGTGTPSIYATTTDPNGVNFCTSVQGVNYWCFNKGAVSGQSLTFTLNFPANQAYLYFGLKYYTGDDYSVLKVTVDGLEIFGSVLTPMVAAGTAGNLQAYPFETTVAERAFPLGNKTVTSALVPHTLIITSVRGTTNIASFIVSDSPILPTITTLYSTANVIPLLSMDIVGGWTYAKANSGAANINQLNPKATWINFCKNPLTPLVDYWCYNGPGPSGQPAHADYFYNAPKDMWVYVGVQYTTAAANSVITVTIDGGYIYFENVPTPVTPGPPSQFQNKFSPTAVLLPAGTHNLRIDILMGGPVNLNALLLNPVPSYGIVDLLSSVNATTGDYLYAFVNTLAGQGVLSAVGVFVVFFFIIVPTCNVFEWPSCNCCAPRKIIVKKKVVKKRAAVPTDANNKKVFEETANTVVIHDSKDSPKLPAGLINRKTPVAKPSTMKMINMEGGGEN